MKRALLLLLLAGAGCHHDVPAESAPKAAATPVRMPFAAVLWKSDGPLDVDPQLLLEKTGILKRPAPVDDDEGGRTWPFALDYWGITRTDAEALLAPYVGRAIRIRGHYKKIDMHGHWRYEVDPESIVLLADPPPSATPAP
jgi:hypothetical protein